MVHHNERQDTMGKHTIVDVGRAILDIAAENPDFVYTQREILHVDGYGSYRGCVYLYDGKPDCLIGRAVDRVFGLASRAVLSGCEHGSSNEVMSALFNEGLMKPYAGDPLLFDLGMAICATQCRQDLGHAWGHAVKPVAHWFDRYES